MTVRASETLPAHAPRHAESRSGVPAARFGRRLPPWRLPPGILYGAVFATTAVLAWERWESAYAVTVSVLTVSAVTISLEIALLLAVPTVGWALFGADGDPTRPRRTDATPISTAADEPNEGGAMSERFSQRRRSTSFSTTLGTKGDAFFLQAEEPLDYSRFGDRVVAILTAAEDAAAQIRGEARADAERIRSDAVSAASESVQVRASAERYSAEVRLEAENYAEDKRREAELRASEIVAAAEDEASAISARADEKARAMIEDAERRIESVDEERRRRHEELATETERQEARLQELLTASREISARLEERIGRAPPGPFEPAVRDADAAVAADDVERSA